MMFVFYPYCLLLSIAVCLDSPAMSPMERVEAEIRARGETLASFAARIGVRSQDINNWKHRGIPWAKRQRVADALGWSLAHLLADEGAESAMHVHQGARSPSASAAGAAPAYPHASSSRALETRDGESSELALWIPTRAIRLSAGQVALTQQEGASLAVTEDWLRQRGLRAERLAVYQAQDAAMAPIIQAGDFLLVDLGERTPSEGGVFLLHADQALLVRRIYLCYDGAWLLRAGDAATRPDQSVPPAAQGVAVHIVGRICWRAGEMRDVT